MYITNQVAYSFHHSQMHEWLFALYDNGCLRVTTVPNYEQPLDQAIMVSGYSSEKKTDRRQDNQKGEQGIARRADRSDEKDRERK